MFLQDVILLAATFASAVWAQFDTAQCGTGFDWNKNSLGQDPCIVGSKLDASCRDLVVFPYTPLKASQYYTPPQTNRSGDVMCDCNTVMYSFFMACTSCQNGTIYSWTQWIAQCVNISISKYPIDIAQGTALPSWAFINVTAKSLPNMTYSDTVAMIVGRDPEALPNSITTVSMVSTSTKSSTDLPVPTNVNDTAKSDNTVAIVGGVVGSVIPLTILAVVAFLYTRKCRQQQVQPDGRQANDPYRRCTGAEYGPSSSFIPPKLSGLGSHTNTALGTYSGAAEV